MDIPIGSPAIEVNDGAIDVSELDYSDTIIGRVWMCTRTLLQLLQDRGYVADWRTDMPGYAVIEQQLRAMDLADTEKSQRLLNQLRRTVKHPQTNETIEVFWVCGKVGKNSDVITGISGILEGAESGASTVVLVIRVEQCTISGPAQAELNKHDDTRLEFFDTEVLLRNITHHKLQPKFKVLTEAEAAETLRAYCARFDELPFILWEDPVRCYFGLKVGQVVRIKRLADGGHDISYRIVQAKQVGKKKK